MQQFEFNQRKKIAPVYELDGEIKDSLRNINVAEAIVGGKMASPEDPKEIAKNFPVVPYYLADDDDEDRDTVETRKSILMAEQMLGRKFTLDPTN